MKLALALLLSAVPLLAGGPEKTVDVTTHDTLDFTGGIIHIDTQYGQVNVEAWDEPRVEVTVSRTSFTHDKQYLERIQVKTEKTDDGIRIATTFPGRNWFARTFHGLGDFNLDYRIKAPAGAKLDIRQHVGDVVVDGIAGDIDASVRSGDIVVEVPNPGQCIVDAKVKVGDVYADAPGKLRQSRWIGQKFASDAGTARQHLHLRVDVGGISVQ